MPWFGKRKRCANPEEEEERRKEDELSWFGLLALGLGSLSLILEDSCNFLVIYSE